MLKEQGNASRNFVITPGQVTDPNAMAPLQGIQNRDYSYDLQVHRRESKRNIWETRLRIHVISLNGKFSYAYVEGPMGSQTIARTREMLQQSFFETAAQIAKDYIIQNPDAR